MIDKDRAAIGMGLGFHVNGVHRAFFDAKIAAFTILPYPTVGIILCKGKVLNIGEYSRKPDAWSVFLGDQQTAFARVANSCVDGNGDIVYVAANCGTGKSIVPMITQKLRHLIDDHAQLMIGAKDLDEGRHCRCRFDLFPVHLHGEDHCIGEEKLEPLEDVAWIDPGVPDIGDAQVAGMLFKFL